MNASRPIRLRFQALEDRTTPASAAYNSLAQTLTITAAQGDQIVVAPEPSDPAGYLFVTEAQAGQTVFDSHANGQAVRNLVVNFAGVDSGNFTLNADARVAGNLTLRAAKTSQIVDLLGTVGGNFTYTPNLKPAFDDVSLEASAVIAGNMTVGLGGGENTLRFKGGLVHGNVNVAGGADADTVEVTATGNLTIDGSLSINLGNGTNTVLGMGLAPQINVGGNFSYTGGTGNDLFNLDGSGTALHVKGDARFTLGTAKVFDANVVKLEALTAGRGVVFTGGVGNDNVQVSGEISTGTNLTVSLGNGSNTFDSDVGGLATNSVGGNFTYTGGTNGDVVNLDAITIARNLTVTLGENGGEGQVLFAGLKGPAGVTVFGNAKVTGGSGSEGILFRRTYVAGSLSVSTFGGTDTVTFDDTNVVGPTLIDLGAGNDLLQMELLTSDAAGQLSKPTTFGGTTTIQGSDGNDTVDLSSDTNATTLVHFGGKVSINGGTGDNSLRNSADNVFEVDSTTTGMTLTTGPALP
jgi:hypothetical protein